MYNINYENLLPDYICKDDERYYLMIVKGSKEEKRWTVGYTNYETELTATFTHENLTIALIALTKELQKTKEYERQLAEYMSECAYRNQKE